MGTWNRRCLSGLQMSTQSYVLTAGVKHAMCQEAQHVLTSVKAANPKGFKYFNEAVETSKII